MAITPAQLDTWSRQGAITTSSAAYASIRHALTKTGSPLVDKALDIYLQGSYANSTNIYGDSDIDVVVMYENTFHYDLSQLPHDQQLLHAQIFSDAAYTWHDLKRDVSIALVAHYGSGAVALGSKSIKVTTGSGRRPSDVIPAVEFRRYAHLNGADDLSAHWGIQFFDSTGRAVVNYPKYHISRGEEKNRAENTRGQYKPTVRVFKNLRNYLVDHRLLSAGAAPSYFIECVLHNVPNSMFSSDYSKSVPAIVDHLLVTSHNTMMCQNGVVPLIGVGSTQWSSEGLTAFLRAIKSNWTSR